MPGRQSSVQIMRTKIFRPVVPEGILCRRELHDELEATEATPLILISAPAGYGKTTLASHWLASCKTRGAWLSLDAGGCPRNSTSTCLKPWKGSSS